MSYTTIPGSTVVLIRSWTSYSLCTPSVVVHQIVPPLQVLGTDELYNYLSKYGIELDPQLENLVGRHARRPWSKFTNAENSHLVTPEGMDFLDKLLKYDHQVRLVFQGTILLEFDTHQPRNAYWLEETVMLCHQESCLIRMVAWYSLTSFFSHTNTQLKWRWSNLPVWLHVSCACTNRPKQGSI